jgi:hypothetical protein
MKTEKIARFPISGSGCGSVKLTSLGVMLLIEFEYHREGRERIGSINFEGVTAYRFRDELHSLGFIKESYDSLVEIQGSDWISKESWILKTVAARLTANFQSRPRPIQNRIRYPGPAGF